jgi:hypothetical protein
VLVPAALGTGAARGTTCDAAVAPYGAAAASWSFQMCGVKCVAFQTCQPLATTAGTADRTMTQLHDMGGGWAACWLRWKPCACCTDTVLGQASQCVSSAYLYSDQHVPPSSLTFLALSLLLLRCAALCELQCWPTSSWVAASWCPPRPSRLRGCGRCGTPQVRSTHSAVPIP